MTTRHAGYIVTLDKDIREDDADQTILVALRAIRGVVDVRPVEASPEVEIARARASYDIERRLWAALRQEEAARLHDTIDAKVWAQEFCRITGFQDEAWVLGWFANAIMAGWDAARKGVLRRLADRSRKRKP